MKYGWMKSFVLMLTALAFATRMPAAEAPAPVVRTSLTDLFENEVIARGKGVEVKRSQLEEALIQYRANLAARGQNLSDAQRNTREAQLLDRLVVTQILVSRATDVDKAKAQELAKKFNAESLKMASSEETFFRQLKALGLSREQYQRRVDEQALAEAVMDREVKSTITIPDAQVKEFYESGTDRLVKIMQEELERLVKNSTTTGAQLAGLKSELDKLRERNLSRLQMPERVRIVHIFIPTLNRDTNEPDSEEQKKSKRAFMDKLLLRARGGEDFGKLVQDFSLDPNLKETKGEYIISRQDEFSAEFKAAAFSLTANQISDVVTTPLGMHIIKLLERMPRQKVEYEKAAEDIKEHLMAQAVQYQLPAFFARIKKEAAVEVLDPKYKLSTAEEPRSAQPPG
jgi:parvulin-like peptidyl-prolyl isomerase